jgi:hypothetical protein
MNRKKVKDFVETLHFHGYIDHDITKLDNLIDDYYYPKQCDEADVSGSFLLAKKIQDLMLNGSGCMECGNYLPTVEEIDVIIKESMR